MAKIKIKKQNRGKFTSWAQSHGMSVQEAARKAMSRNSGARGLRSVMEAAMLDVMYELPSDEHAVECVINEQVIADGEYPVILYDAEDKKTA